MISSMNDFPSTKLALWEIGCFVAIVKLLQCLEANDKHGMQRSLIDIRVLHQTVQFSFSSDPFFLTITHG